MKIEKLVEEGATFKNYEKTKKKAFDKEALMQMKSPIEKVWAEN